MPSGLLAILSVISDKSRRSPWRTPLDGSLVEGSRFQDLQFETWGLGTRQQAFSLRLSSVAQWRFFDMLLPRCALLEDLLGQVIADLGVVLQHLEIPALQQLFLALMQ